MVTHEDDIAEHAKRIIRMRDGLIIDDGPSPRMAAAQAALIGTTASRPMACDGHWERRISAPGDPELRPSSEELTH